MSDVKLWHMPNNDSLEISMIENIMDCPQAQAMVAKYRDQIHNCEKLALFVYGEMITMGISEGVMVSQYNCDFSKKVVEFYTKDCIPDYVRRSCLTAEDWEEYLQEETHNLFYFLNVFIPLCVPWVKSVLRHRHVNQCISDRVYMLYTGDQMCPVLLHCEASHER